jgi:phenylalanyl-tRNA synthetase beta chain
MFISYQWLRELTGTTLNPQEIRERLTNVGLAIDNVEERGDDSVLDVEVASNRGDCLSHVGVARELAVIENLRFQIPDSRNEKSNGKTSDFASVEINDPDLCPRYAARIVRGVKIGPSPDWLAKRLETIGQRPINSVADITNYVLHEFGQPLHAFDLAKLGKNRIVVRRATKGEAIKTLDGVERKLGSEMLVIADASRAVAVAGVMGGEDSEISSATTDVLIESAHFNPASVRQTAKLLALHTEASHRFERGVDPEGVLRALERCVSMICEIAGGLATEDAIDAYPNPIEQRTAGLRPDRIESLTGLQVDRADVLRILEALGFVLRTNETDVLAFAVPSWRYDVAIEEDLIEEVARHTGFDKIGTALPPASLAGEYHVSESRKRAARRALAARGFNEAINLSFIPPTDKFELISAFANRGAERFVTLSNPIVEEASCMRPTLLPGLLQSLRHNLNHGTRDVCLFEIGRVFAVDQKGELPEEREVLGLCATGGIVEADRASATRELDFFDLKGALESAIDAMNLPPLVFQDTSAKHLRPGQAAKVILKDKAVGLIGALSESVAAEQKFRQPVFVAEVDLSELFEVTESASLYSPLPRFPAIVRDVSLLVGRKVSVAELLSAARVQAVEHFAGAEFVGAFEGQGIPDDKRSVTLRFEYRAADRTLRDEEVDHLHWPLVETLKHKFSAEVR